jgi:ferredoxin
MKWFKTAPKKEKSFEVCNRERKVPFEAGDTVLSALLESHLDVAHECGGQGICGTCRVFVLEGSSQLGAKNKFEKERSKNFGYSENERLSCQILAHESLAIDLPEN